jgi:hypothetical protein
MSIVKDRAIMFGPMMGGVSLADLNGARKLTRPLVSTGARQLRIL